MRVSEIMTVAHVPGLFGSGYMDYGRMSRAEIIARAKGLAESEMEKYRRLLATPDDAFEVRIVRGKNVQHLIERLPA
jgi:hypothetical protein